MPELVDALRDSGFEAVESDIPGRWYTDGDVTVAVNAQPGAGSHASVHDVRVYGGTPEFIDVGTAEEVGYGRESSLSVAVRGALDEAGVADAHGGGEGDGDPEPDEVRTDGGRRPGYVAPDDREQTREARAMRAQRRRTRLVDGHRLASRREL